MGKVGCLLLLRLVTVSAANDRDSVIEIPATVKYLGMDYRIDELEDSAFAAHPFLKRVVMPDNPKLHVMKHIFAGSPNLESIYFRITSLRSEILYESQTISF